MNTLTDLLSKLTVCPAADLCFVMVRETHPGALCEIDEKLERGCLNLELNLVCSGVSGVGLNDVTMSLEISTI